MSPPDAFDNAPPPLSHACGSGARQPPPRFYSNGAIGTMTGFAGTGLGALGALAGFTAGTSGTDAVASPDSSGRERGSGAASRFAGDVTP
jgi:hypothetical protein